MGCFDAIWLPQFPLLHQGSPIACRTFQRVIRFSRTLLVNVVGQCLLMKLSNDVHKIEVTKVGPNYPLSCSLDVHIVQ